MQGAPGGLFGTGAKSSPFSFGGSSQPAAAAPAPSTSGLFGGLSGSEPGASGSLFGSTIGASQQGGPSLARNSTSPFGASTAPAASTSLFGASRLPGSENTSSTAAPTAPTSSGLFGRSHTGAGLFGSSSTGGPSSVFGGHVGGPPASGVFGGATGGRPPSSSSSFGGGTGSAGPSASSGGESLMSSSSGEPSPGSASTSIFGGGPTVNTSTTIFGSASKGFAPPSLFGGAAPKEGPFSRMSEAPSRGSVFWSASGGGPSCAATTSGTLLQPVPAASGSSLATAGSSSLFGGFAAGSGGPSFSVAPTSTSLFGGSSTGPSAIGGANSSSGNGLFSVASHRGSLGTTVFGSSKEGEAPKGNAGGVSLFGAPAAAGLFGGSTTAAGAPQAAAAVPSAGLFSGSQGATTSNPAGRGLFGGPSAGSASVSALGASSNTLIGAATGGAFSAVSSGSSGTGEPIEERAPAIKDVFSAGGRSNLIRGFFGGRKAGESTPAVSAAAAPAAPTAPLQRSSSSGGCLLVAGSLRDGGGAPCFNPPLSGVESNSSSGVIAVHGRSKLCVPDGAAVPPPLPEPSGPNGNPMLRGSFSEGSLMLRVQVVQQLQQLVQESQSNTGNAGGVAAGSDPAAAAGGGGAFVGQLFGCCSTEEMLDKQQVSTASDFERLDATVPGDPEARIVNVHLAFASFRRSDAGKPFKQSDTRPAVWCRRAVHALLTYCADADLTNGASQQQQQQQQSLLPRKEYLYPRSRPYTYMDVYNFLRDRLRACWQELTVQHVSPHRASIETLEISFRFLVLSEELLAGTTGFDAVSNHGLMQTCLDKLMQGYEAARAFRSKRDATAAAAAAAAAATAAAAGRGLGGGLGPDELLDLLVFSSPYEGEFWGFRLLMLLAQEASDTALVSLLQRLPPQLQQDPSVRFSLSAYRAFKALDLRRYVRLMREGPYLLCLLLHKFLPFGRARLLAALVTGRLAGGTRNPISAQRLSVLMGFDGEDEALFLSFLKAYGIRTSVSPRGVSICLLDEIDKGLLQDLSSYKKAKGPRAPSAFLLAPQFVSRQQLLDPDYPANSPAPAAAAAVGVTQQQRRPSAAELSREFYFKHKQRLHQYQHGQQQQQEGFHKQERLQRLQEQQRLKLQQQRGFQVSQPSGKDAQQQSQQQQQQQLLLLQFQPQQQRQQQQLQQEQQRKVRDPRSLFTFGTQGPQKAAPTGATASAAVAPSASAAPGEPSFFGERMQEDRAELSQQQQQQQQHMRWQQQEQLQQQQPQQQQQSLPFLASMGERQPEQKQQALQEQWTKHHQRQQEQEQVQRNPLFLKEISPTFIGSSGVRTIQEAVERQPAASGAASAPPGGANERKQGGITNALTGLPLATTAPLLSSPEAAGGSSAASQRPCERLDNSTEQPLNGVRAKPAESAPGAAVGAAAGAAVGAAASVSRVAAAGSSSPELPRSRGPGSPFLAVKDGGTSSKSLKSGTVAASPAGAKVALSNADAPEPFEHLNESGSDRGGLEGIVGLRQWRRSKFIAEDKQDAITTLPTERVLDKGPQTLGATGAAFNEKAALAAEGRHEAEQKPKRQLQRSEEERDRRVEPGPHAKKEERVRDAAERTETEMLQGGVKASAEAKPKTATPAGAPLSEVGTDGGKTEGAALAARSIEDDLLLLLKQQTEWPRQPLSAAVAAAVAAAAAAHEGTLKTLLSPADQQDSQLCSQPRLFFKVVIYCRRAAAVEGLLVRILATAACARLPSGSNSFPPMLLRGKLAAAAPAAALSKTATGTCLAGNLLLWPQQAISLPQLLLPLPLFCALHAVGGVGADEAAARTPGAVAALKAASGEGQDKFAYELDVNEAVQGAAMLLMPLPFLVALPSVSQGPAAAIAVAGASCGNSSLPTVVLQPAGVSKGSRTLAAAAAAATQQWATAATEIVHLLKQQQQQQQHEGSPAFLAVVFALSLHQRCFGVASSAAQAASPQQRQHQQQYQQQLVISVDEDVRLACSAVRSEIRRSIAERYPEYSGAVASLRVRCVCVVPECASCSNSNDKTETTSSSSSSCLDGTCCTEKALPLSGGLLQSLSLDPWEASRRDGFLQSLLRQRPQLQQQKRLVLSAWERMWGSALDAAAAAAQARARQSLRDGLAAQLQHHQPQPQPPQEQQRQQQCGLEGGFMEELVAFAAAQQVAYVAADAAVSAEAFRAAAAAAAGSLHSCRRDLWRLPPAEWLLSLIARLQQQHQETIAGADRAACFPSTDIALWYELMMPFLEQQRGRQRPQDQQEVLRVLRQVYSKPAALTQLLRLAEAAKVNQWQQRQQQHPSIREAFAAALESAWRCAAAAAGKAGPLVLPSAAACQINISSLQWWGRRPLPSRLLITEAALQQQEEQTKDSQQLMQQPQPTGYIDKVQQKPERDRPPKRVLTRQGPPLSKERPQKLRQRLYRSAFRLASDCMRLAAEDSQKTRALLESLKL